jgi:type II secretory pathway component GspD/PulD (secretin)
VATVKAWAGFLVALGLVPAASAAVLPSGLLSTAYSVGQSSERNASAHSVLNNAIDCYRRGDYERAAVLLQRAQVNQADLIPDEVNDLNTYLRLNNQALKARADGASQLRKAEKALNAGKKGEAAAILKALNANQYLTAGDRQLAQQLSGRLRGASAAFAHEQGPELNPAAAVSNPAARARLREARTMLSKGDYQGATDKALEAERLGGTYMVDEDTPSKVLEDVDKARHGIKVSAPTVAKAPVAKMGAKPDAQTLLVAARTALQKGDFDGAEGLTAEAEKAAAQARGVLPAWMHPWSDSPAKVRKDIEVGRAKEAAVKTARRKEEEKAAQAALKPEGETQAKPETKPTAFGAIKGLFVRGNPQQMPDGAAKPEGANDDKDDKKKEIVQVSAKTDVDPMKADAQLAAPPSDKTATARKLIQDGRKAMQEGNLAAARQMAEKARDLKPDLRWWDDNPDKLLADVRRREARLVRTPVKPETKAVVLAGAKEVVPAAAPDGPDLDKALTPAEARKLVKEARALYAANKLEEAERLTRSAGGVKTRWGLFEDSPEKLRIDIQAVRGRRDKDASVKVLAEARSLYAKGDFKEAKKKAYQAQKLHGAYSWYDLGDRPNRLVYEIEVAEVKARKSGRQTASAAGDKRNTATARTDDTNATTGPGAARADSGPMAKDERPSTSGSTAEQRAAKAREYLAEARQQLINKNFTLAKQYTDKVVQIGVEWEAARQGPPPWSDSLFVLRRDIQQAAYRAEAIVPPVGSRAPVESTRPALVEETTQPTGTMREQVAQDLGKQKAKMLVAEARALQASGRLVEARQKALEAQRTSIAFGPDEDRPERVLLHLAGLCDQKIELLLKLAEDYVREGGDIEHIRKAEANLQTAKELSNGFGLDAYRVEHKIAWLQGVQDRLQAKGPAALVEGTILPAQPAPAADVVKVVGKETIKGPDPLTMKQQGEELLDKARLELRAGQNNQARRFANAVFTGEFGMRKEAENMLRTIDNEEFKQSILEANRTAEAGFSAFNRRDYAHAARVLAAIDPRQLATAKQARLREIMMTPEMQAVSSEGKAAAPTVVVQANDGKGAPKLHPLNEEGKATATDEAVPVADPAREDGGMLATAAGMQEIKFQELHVEQRNVQKKAMECFKAGDTERAVEMLRDFSNNLDNSELDRARIAMLKRPVEDRLQKLTMLKAQGEFERGQKAVKANANDQMTRMALAEKRKQDQVADLMKRYHTFYKEGKYGEAQALAQQCLEVDPDNVAASAGVQLAQTQGRLKDFHEISKEKEEFDLRALNDTDTVGPSVVVDPLKFNDKIWKRAGKRHGYPDGIPGLVRSQRERDIERRLQAPISLNFKDARLGDVIDSLHDLSGLNVVPDKAALDENSISMDKQLDLRVENISMKSALNLLLQQLHLTYVVKDEALVITTEDNARGKLKRVVYPVADLVVPVESHDLPASADFKTFLDKSSNTNIASPYNVNAYPGPYGMKDGAPVSSPGTGSYVPPGSTTQSGGPTVTRNGPGHTIEDTLIKLITSTIAPQSWTDVSGQGTIQYFPTGMALIINQTQDLQEQIADLLAALRRLQDLEVAIEMRLVSVSESFFERIGLDFNVNIVNKNVKFSNNLLNGQFQPFGFINKFTPNNFVSGLTPAGTLTPDLGIPLQQNSFALTTPPFGYPGTIPDGGLSLGLAFLSDIQVFMFMEAAQGDRRFNLMQAPKLTMFNGQSATLNVQDFQFFLTSVSPGFTPTGQIYFIPNNIPVPLGVSLTVQPVVSADRRFVRMNLAPQLTNLTNANVPITLGPQQAGIPQQQGGQGQFPIPTAPIQIPVPTVFEGGVVAPNQGGLFQIFLQQPTTTQISIQTTVSVPDGGTVLLGGLKTLSEGRSEFGPPILSKIPYINRLFKNVGYGREAQSLLIMVTPRIIINEEEEIRQTGGVGGVAGAGPGS